MLISGNVYLNYCIVYLYFRYDTFLWLILHNPNHFFNQESVYSIFHPLEFLQELFYVNCIALQHFNYTEINVIEMKNLFRGRTSIGVIPHIGSGPQTNNWLKYELDAYFCRGRVSMVRNRKQHYPLIFFLKIEICGLKAL